jgi:hypothetical protein
VTIALFVAEFVIKNSPSRVLAFVGIFGQAALSLTPMSLSRRRQNHIAISGRR